MLEQNKGGGYFACLHGGGGAGRFFRVLLSADVDIATFGQLLFSFLFAELDALFLSPSPQLLRVQPRVFVLELMVAAGHLQKITKRFSV